MSEGIETRSEGRCSFPVEEATSRSIARRTAWAALILGDEERHVRDLVAARERNPRVNVYSRDLGHLAQSKGDLDGAIEHFEHAVRIDPDIVGAWDETRGGELVGYAVCVGDGTLVATIERVCVREDMRGRGIGRGLVHALGEKMFEREIYDVGVRAPEALVGFFDSLNYDDDDSVCMRFEATVEEGAHISS